MVKYQATWKGSISPFLQKFRNAHFKCQAILAVELTSAKTSFIGFPLPLFPISIDRLYPTTWMCIKSLICNSITANSYRNWIMYVVHIFFPVLFIVPSQAKYPFRSLKHLGPNVKLASFFSFFHFISFGLVFFTNFLHHSQPYSAFRIRSGQIHLTQNWIRHCLGMPTNIIAIGIFGIDISKTEELSQNWDGVYGSGRIWWWWRWISGGGWWRRQGRQAGRQDRRAGGTRSVLRKEKVEDCLHRKIGRRENPY